MALVPQWLIQTIVASQFYLYGRQHFTENGWKLNSAEYPKPDPLTTSNLTNKVYVITGATSGIGKKITEILSDRGATVYMISRNEQKSFAVQNEIRTLTNNQNIFSIIADVGLSTDVIRASKEISNMLGKLESGYHGIDGLICNAGVLLSTMTQTKESLETTLATHLIHGTYLLTNELLPVLARAPEPRVVVVSSGGMLTTKWPGMDMALSSLHQEKYDGQLTYAYAKRGQVLLVKEWSKIATQQENQNTYGHIKFVSAHPGWVDTPGVREAYGIAGAYLLAPLRTLYSGSEGIAWLASCSSNLLQNGGFYLDRSLQQEHLPLKFLSFDLNDFTRNNEAEVEELMDSLSKLTLNQKKSYWLNKGEQC